MKPVVVKSDTLFVGFYDTDGDGHTAERFIISDTEGYVVWEVDIEDGVEAWGYMLDPDARFVAVIVGNELRVYRIWR